MAKSARENILQKIKQALAKPVPVPFSAVDTASTTYPTTQEDLSVLFAENFSGLQGKFAFCASEKELASQLSMLFIQRNWKQTYCRENRLIDMLTKAGFGGMQSEDLEYCDAAITSCDNLIARTGSMILSSAQQSGRTVSVYAPIHICIAYTDQVVYDISDGLKSVTKHYGNQLPSLITLASGPSRTADIEKTLVVGVHGPKEVYCFLVDRNN
jgi:L-lactate dehydrogenase complex protein LldG